MILLNSAINERLGALGEGDESRLGAQAEIMSENARARMQELNQLSGEPFDAAFAGWVTEAYPDRIEAWSQLGNNQTFAELSQAVVPRLEEHLSIAKDVAAGSGGAASGGDATRAEEETNGPTGGEGQTGERQHTPEPNSKSIRSPRRSLYRAVRNSRHACGGRFQCSARGIVFAFLRA